MELVQIASNAAYFGISTIETFGSSTVLLLLMYLAIHKRLQCKYLKILGVSNFYCP
jgi:hypothetical protein